MARKAAGAAIDELLCMPPKRHQPQKHDDTDTDDEAKVFKIEEKVYKGSGSATDAQVSTSRPADRTASSMARERAAATLGVTMA